MSGDMMTEDAEEYSPLWWKLRWYNDDKFENELIEAIRAKDKPSAQGPSTGYPSLYAASCSSSLAGYRGTSDFRLRVNPAP